MIVYNANIPLKITVTVPVDNYEETLDEFYYGVEELLDFDCDLDDTETIEKNGKIENTFFISAYLEVSSENDDEASCLKKLEENKRVLQSLITDNVKAEIEFGDMEKDKKYYQDRDEYLTDVLGASCLTLMDDSEFLASFTALLFGDCDWEIANLHISSSVPYFQGTDPDGNHFTLALRINGDEKRDVLSSCLPHTDKIFPRGDVYLAEIALGDKKAKTTEWQNKAEIGEEENLYIRRINLGEEDRGDAFYAVDTLRCCLEDDYESGLEDEE